MKLKDLTAIDLETITYDDLAFLILEDSGKKSKIADLFTKVCKILKLSEQEYENHIGDFFELLSTDKRFIMLENGFWDLRDKHSKKVVIEEEDDDAMADSVEADNDDDVESEEVENIFYDADETDDESDDDLKDFVVIDEDEEETNGSL